jgi:hypothetical protein
LRKKALAIGPALFGAEVVPVVTAARVGQAALSTNRSRARGPG